MGSPQRTTAAAARAALLLVALAASLLLLVPGSAYAKDIKDTSAFTYKTGTLTWEGTVAYGEKLGKSYSISLGEGVCITGYSEDLVDDVAKDRLVIPDTINGKKVLWVNLGSEAELGEAAPYEQPIIDVSQCTSLQVLELRQTQSVTLGNISSLKVFRAEGMRSGGSIDLTKNSGLRHFTINEAPQSIQLAKQNLVSCAVYQYCPDQLDLSNAGNLELLHLDADGSLINSSTLQLDNCRALKYVSITGGCLNSFDVSKFPKLEYLYLLGNYISDTAPITAWLKAHNNSGLVELQQKAVKQLPSNVRLNATSFPYDGTPKKPTVTAPGLREGVDYKVIYLDNVQAGTAKAVICGMGDDAYQGSVVVKTFTITKPTSSSNQGSKPQSTPPATVTPANTSIANAAVTVKDKVYTGKTLKPSSVVVKVGGRTLRQGADYTVTCKDGKKIGSYTVTIKGKGAYTGTATAKFKIVPKGVAAKKPSAAKRGFTAKWKRPSSKYLKQTTGYEVMWSTDKKFKKAVKSKLVKGAKKTSLKVTKLKPKKTYYVKIRAYKQVGKTKYYSSWSKVQKVKTKK